MAILSFSSLRATMAAVWVKLYLVTCDLLHAGDYQSFKTRLRTLGAKHVLSSQCVLRSTHTAAELKDHLREFMDDGDRIVVAEVGEERASRRAMAKVGEL